MSNPRAGIASFACVLGLAAATGASAQTVDHGALEDLFGEPVTTSATGAPQRISESPATMTIISAEDIRRSGARTLPDVLALATGLDVRRVSQGGVDVSIRGYNQAMSPRLLVLVNGRQVYLDHYGFTNWDLVPVELSEIRQIEIVEGPASALFGFNAVSGVINIITYSPLYDNARALEVRAGSQEYREASGVATFHFGAAAGLRVSGGYYEADEFADAAAAAQGEVSPRRRHVSAEFLGQLSPATQIGIEATYVDGRRSGLTPDFSLETTDGETWSGRIYGVSATPLGLVKASLYQNYFDNTIAFGPATFQLGNRVTVAQVEDLFKIGADHTIRLAGEFRHNALISGGSAEFDLSSASLMWAWRMSPALSWTNAVRVDHMEASGGAGAPPGGPPDGPPDGPPGGPPDAPAGPPASHDLTEPSFNSSLVWRLSPVDMLRVSIGRGAEAPTLLELASDVATHPAILTSAELSYGRRIAATGGNVRATLFAQRLQDVKTLNADQLGDSRSWGLELELDGALGEHLDWRLGYTYQNVEDDLDTMVAGVLTAPAAFEQTTSDHILVGEISYSRGDWEFNLSARSVFASDQIGVSGITNVLERVPSYVSIGARVGVAVTDHLALELVGQDLGEDGARQFARFGVEPRIWLALRANY